MGVHSTPSANNFLRQKNNKVSACILVTVVTKLPRCKWQLAFRHPLNSMIKKSHCELFCNQFSNQHFHLVLFCQQRQTCQAILAESSAHTSSFSLTQSLADTLVRWRDGGLHGSRRNLQCIEEVTDLVILDTSKVKRAGCISPIYHIPTESVKRSTVFLASEWSSSHMQKMHQTSVLLFLKQSRFISKE